MLCLQETKITQQQSAVPKVEDKSSVGPSEPAEPAAVVTNGGMIFVLFILLKRIYLNLIL
jgi:hypothetical protein